MWNAISLVLDLNSCHVSISGDETTATSTIIIIIIISLLWEFFTPALADGFSLEFEWQQVSSSL